MFFENSNGLKLYYEVHGEGEPLLFLHHGFGCTKMWKEITPSFVDQGYKVIMHDRRGYGQSEKGADFRAFYTGDGLRPESVSETAALLKLLQVDSFHIVGQCEGGVIGVDYANTYPNQVRSLAISSTQCYSTLTMEELNKVKFQKGFHELEEELREKLIEWHGKEHAEAFYEQFRTFGGAYGRAAFDLRPDLSSIACPTLVLYPDRSYLFDVEQAVAMYRALPTGELAVLPNCGHNNYEHQPEAYIRIVSDYIKRQRP
jgi:pimeloyl-ACP methyl ester carboxylesterase